ncbi:MAG: hypothetical protein M4579_000873 [Chaenotheca gracillima]|nr:MAG: hypothetical protein M4579_000873 [Chaenotheca gracillima]
MSSSNTGQASGSGTYQSESWKNLDDPKERRKVQNRNAQRKYRQDKKTKAEDNARDTENRQQAENAYRGANPNDSTGPPWGGPSMGYIISGGQRPTAEQDPYAGTSSSNTYYDGSYGSGYTQQRSTSGQ